MYNLPYYKENDKQVILEFIHKNPFSFISGCSAENKPVATQIPVFIEERDGKLYMSGHMMKHTDHHKAFEQNSNVLCVFTGHHTYVSATWYKNPSQASTWNYMSVYVKGKLRFLDDQGLVDILKKTTLHFENGNLQSSTVYDNLPDDYKNKLMKAIVAFEVEVEHMDTVFKLSQDRDEESYQNIINKLDEGGGDGKTIADEMKKELHNYFILNKAILSGHQLSLYMRCISFVAILLITSCSIQKKLSNSVPSEFDKQGHRGSRGLMPENTWPAMKTALDLGVTTLEMDVVITKDKKVILSHEPWFNHDITTKPDGSFIKTAEEKNFNIYSMTYDDVKTYDVGLKPNPRFPKQQKLKAIKPLLSDLVDSINQYMVTSRRTLPYYNIETKCNPSGDNIFHPAPEEFVELLMDVIKLKRIEDKVIIQSFDFRTLRYLHQKYPHIKTAMLTETSIALEDGLKDLGFIPTIYSPHFSAVNKDVIEQCHQKGIKIIPWTVNEKSKIIKLIALRVDGIITDYPDLFNEL